MPIGKGTQLQMGDGAGPEVFTAIAKLDTIAWSGIEGEAMDETDFDSADFGEQVSGGLLKWGEVTFEGNWTGDAQQMAFHAAVLAHVVKNFKIVFPSSVASSYDTLSFSGLPLKFGPISAGAKDKMRISGAIKLAGKPTFA
jgi:hypothetical protein